MQGAVIFPPLLILFSCYRVEFGEAYHKKNAALQMKNGVFITFFIWDYFVKLIKRSV